jgi:hypothetical protein
MADDSYIFDVLDEDSSYLDTVGGLAEIETARLVSEQFPQQTSLREYVRTGGSGLSTDSIIGEGEQILSLIRNFSSEQRRELNKLLSGAKETTDIASTRLDDMLTSFEGVVNTFNEQLEEQRKRFREQELLAEEEQKKLEEANRRALTGEGMIRQTAPARALGIGEIMTGGRAARGGSQRAATSEFLRNPPMIGEYDG